MASNGLVEYHDFLRFRDDLISKIYSISVSHEIKEGVIARPVGIIRTDEEFKYFSGALMKWKEQVTKLNNLDPLTYPLTATKFGPIPEVVDGAKSISISLNKSTAVRTIKKDVLMRRLRAHIKALATSTTPASKALTEHLQDELSEMETDGETAYISRNSNGTETVLIIYPIVGEQYRKRVPFAGALIDNRFGDVAVGMAKQIKQRNDSFDYLGVTPIRCSLPNVSGLLYPKSAVEKAKRIAHESKIPISN
ncbi:hypothetical protein ABKY47_002061 [Aeromonas hydrophila]